MLHKTIVHISPTMNILDFVQELLTIMKINCLDEQSALNFAYWSRFFLLVGVEVALQVALGVLDRKRAACVAKIEVVAQGRQ